MKKQLMILIATLMTLSAVAAPLPAQRRSAPSQVRITWDNATNSVDGRTLNPAKLSTRLFKLPPPWSGDPMTNTTWTLTVTVPSTTQTTTVSVTEGEWAFACQHVYVDEFFSTNDSAMSLLLWTNVPMVPGSPAIR